MRGVGLNDRITLWPFDTRENLRMRYYIRVPHGMSKSRLWTRAVRPDTVALRLNPGSFDYAQGNGRYEKRSCA